MKNMKIKRINNTAVKGKGPAGPAGSQATPGRCLQNRKEIHEYRGGGAVRMAYRAQEMQGEKQPKPVERRPIKKQKAFLRAFGDGGSVTHAALVAGIDCATHDGWMASDAKYKAAFEATMPMAAGALQDRLVDLANNGVFEPLVY
jgi:hypothetical protein